MNKIINISILTAIFAIALLSCDEVTPVTLESISVTEQPDKKTYIVGDEFDPSGMEVTATYSNESTKPVPDDKLEFEYDFSSAGTNKKVTISYTEKEKTVTARVSGITVTAPPAGNKTVTIQAQIGNMTAGTASSVTFPVTTTNIANGKEATIGWFTDATGNTLANDPKGITPKMTTLTNNAATIILEGSAAIVAGTYYYRIQIDGTMSNVATLTISSGGTEPSQTVTVAAQSLPLTAGVAGSTTFGVTTTNILKVP